MLACRLQENASSSIALHCCFAAFVVIMYYFSTYSVSEKKNCNRLMMK